MLPEEMVFEKGLRERRKDAHLVWDWPGQRPRGLQVLGRLCSLANVGVGGRDETGEVGKGQVLKSLELCLWSSSLTLGTREPG